MLDFTELSKDGQDLELLVRELLFRRGFSVYWSGRGPDGGRDLICVERRDSFFVPDEKRWLIQCKHNAHGGRSVGKADLDDVVDSCQQHQCRGYLLVTSTYPSSAVVQRLESITNNPRSQIEAIYWDAVRLEQTLSTPQNWSLAQRFFPISANAETWQVYATESPNTWVINYKGYYFHLNNRDGKYKEYQLGSIKNRITDIESIRLPEDHFIRIRAVHHDDAYGGYTWYLDYMYPNDQRPAVGTSHIAHELGDGYALEDGQVHNFDIICRSYIKNSDHYDPDYSEYYLGDLSFFRYGTERPRDFESYEEAENSRRQVQEQIEREKNKGYDTLVEKFKSLSFLKIVRSRNANIEDLDKFHRRMNWSEVIEELDLEIDRFFSAWFLFEAKDETELHRMMTYIPQRIEYHFRLARACIYVPSEDSEGSTRADTPEDALYELTVSIHPNCIGNKMTGRSLLNDYFLTIVERLDKFLSNNER